MVVSGGPDGEVRWNWSYEGGRPGRGTPGAAPGATVSFTILEPDARALLAGELDPSVAFMRGRLKTAGDPGLVLALLEPDSDGGFQQWRRALAGRTTF